MLCLFQESLAKCYMTRLISYYSITKHMIYSKPFKTLVSEDLLLFLREIIKVNETYIRGNKDKPCQEICGENANALYVKALQEPFGTGCYVDRKAPLLKQEPYVKCMSMYFWLDLVAEDEGISIKHRVNYERKQRGMYWPISCRWVRLRNEYSL